VSGSLSKTQLAELVRQTALLTGDFVLRSGRRSKYYLDKYLFETQPTVLAELGRLLAQHATSKTSRIAGAELGGVPLAAATSLASGLPFVIVRNTRKDYGTAKLLEGRLEKGDRVLLVEDVVTTGGATLQAAKALTEAGAVVEKIVAVIDRQEGGRENIESAGYAFEAILTRSDLGIEP